MSLRLFHLLAAARLLVLTGCLAPIGEDAPPTGARLALGFTTTPSPIGQYSPLNCVVAWVERDAGFVKTLDRQCAVRTQHLIAWNAASGGDTDAVTGASRPNHDARIEVVWDLTDRDGSEVPDGAYTLRLESTETNATSEFQNNQGSFELIKGGVRMQSGLANGGFVDVSIELVP